MTREEALNEAVSAYRDIAPVASVHPWWADGFLWMVIVVAAYWIVGEWILRGR